MSFIHRLDEHIEYMLSEGVLPDADEIMEMDALGGVEVPGQQLGPQASGPEGGPVSPPGAVFPWKGNLQAAPAFRGASMGTVIPPAMFRHQNAIIPPAAFQGAAVEDQDDDIFASVLADLEELNSR